MNFSNSHLGEALDMYSIETVSVPGCSCVFGRYVASLYIEKEGRSKWNCARLVKVVILDTENEY
jgi:hypothetical protein